MTTKKTDESNFMQKDYRADKALTPIKAIREQCKICTCYNGASIRNCDIYYCPLFPYRMGKRPK